MGKLLLGFYLVLLSFISIAEEITDEKKRVIDEMLEITGALEIGEMMGTAVADQMISALAQQDQNMDARVVGIIKDEISKIMHDEFIANGFIHDMSYRIYHKYFTTDELKQVVMFYKTPAGSKMATYLPQVTQEAMIAGQQHGASLGPVIESRLMARFRKEGIR